MVRLNRGLLDVLGSHGTLTELPPTDDDWYGNLLWLDRRKCLLLTHADTLFSIFQAGIRKADLRPIGSYIVKTVEAELREENLPPTPSADSILTTSVSRRRPAAAPSAL